MPPKKTDGGPAKDKVERITSWPHTDNVPVCEKCKAPASAAVCDYTRLHDPVTGKLGYAMIGLPHYFCAEHKRDAIIKDA